MISYPRPTLVTSRCLGFEACRWNGVTIPTEYVDQLKPYVTFITPCPEVMIGLGVPRKPIRFIEPQPGEVRLVQPETGADFTAAMDTFCSEYLNTLPELDGFILKSQSPSCGIAGVKVYRGMHKSPVVRKTRGFFGGAVFERYGHLPIEDEGRLSNFTIREHFLTAIFTLARFRELKSNASMKALIEFQASHKHLLLSYNQSEMRLMGKVVANHDKKPLEEVLASYETGLRRALSKAPRFTSNINVLMHALGYVSEHLSTDEKAFFLDSLENYRSGLVPLSVPVHLMRSWIIRFGVDYLAQQTYFQPFPADLMDITDSGKGRQKGR